MKADMDTWLTSTAAASVLPSLIASSLAAKATCTHGKTFATAPAVILIAGLFDYATLRQAGFSKVTCSLGTHLNADRFRQLGEGQRTVDLAFNRDQTQSGQQAAEQLVHRLVARGICARRVLLPEGHDPNPFFVQGGDTAHFQALLEAARLCGGFENRAWSSDGPRPICL